MVLSGPSGVGKDTLLRGALGRDPNLATIVTAKTRAARPGERHGVHHLFLSDAEFDALIAAAGFLEYADVYDHRSGVPRDQVVRLFAERRTVIVRTDIQGAVTLRREVPGAVLVFVAAPDRAALERRLRARNTESTPELERRLAAVPKEMEAAADFDYVVVNHEDREDDAVSELLDLLRAERDRPGRIAPRL